MSEENKEKDQNAISEPEQKQTQEKNPERMWAMFCHLSALVSMLVWIPGANILGPLIIWLVKKNEFSSVDIEGKEALNFQICMTLYALVAFISVIGMFFLPIIGIINLVLVIIASVKTNNGEKYQYPLIAYRFLK